jgi:hypothetical protein
LQENLADLNNRLANSSDGGAGAELPMNRFRPNIILAGGGVDAWADDAWGSVGIGSANNNDSSSASAAGVELSYVKPCSRCKVGGGLVPRVAVGCACAAQTLAAACVLQRTTARVLRVVCATSPTHPTHAHDATHHAGDHHQPGDGRGGAGAAQDAGHVQVWGLLEQL